jgi:tetratricopeptide (TPR) repeat protein
LSRRNLLALIFSICAFPFFFGCSTVKKMADKTAIALNIVEHVDVKTPTEAPEDYQDGMNQLQTNQNAEALETFDDFLKEEPTSSWTQAARLNSGRALEGLSRWSEAADRYHLVIQSTNSAPKLQAMALYRLSFCQEALAQDQEAVITLNDVMNRSASLPREIKEAELPARLAAAYARVGNFDRATHFYSQAESGIARLRQEALRNGAAVPEWLPKTLLVMGQMSFRHLTWEEFDTALRPVARAQNYLLQAAEFDFEPWSADAVKELTTIYQNLWSVIENVAVPSAGDELVSQRTVQTLKWDRALSLYECLNQLSARLLPESTSESLNALEIKKFAQVMVKKVDELLSQRRIGEGLTPESEERLKAVRGHVIAPDGVLEREFYIKRIENTLPATQIPDKTEKTPKAIIREAPAKDPNL